MSYVLACGLYRVSLVGILLTGIVAIAASLYWRSSVKRRKRQMVLVRLANLRAEEILEILDSDNMTGAHDPHYDEAVGLWKDAAKKKGSLAAAMFFDVWRLSWFLQSRAISKAHAINHLRRCVKLEELSGVSGTQTRMTLTEVIDGTPVGHTRRR